MMAISEDAKYQARVDIEHKFVQSLILINSGAIIALLGFAQAVIDSNIELAIVSFYGLRFFCLGLVSGVLVNYFRYRVNTLKASNQDAGVERNKILSYVSRFLSLGAFIFGFLYISIRGVEIIAL
ncbi:hypothetical protein VH441_06875 [Psychrobacter sp. HD31]|uniref:hypothetical protein n=1 Tax=Psychrobacter sp. HD31 TaxID=3112003 RepID=UPI003DA47189